MMHTTLTLTLVACALSTSQAQSVSLTGETNVVFASVEQGRALLKQRDLFVNSLSRFDKQARLKTGNEVSTEQFLEFVSSQVLPWADADTRKVAEVIERIRPKLRNFDLPFPRTILLVHTSGKEEGGAAYCRGNAVMLPETVLHRSPAQLDRLIMHELFHVLSNHNPELRRKLYAIVGFHPCGEVPLPKSLVDRRITNPDAPTLDYAVTLSIDGQKRQAVPVLFGPVDNYDPDGGRSLFQLLQFRLMVVEKSGEKSRPVMRDGQPLLIDASKLPDYFDQIGRNTNYIIHPEEILADNFVHLVNESTELKTPRIVDEMRRILARD